MISPSLFNLTSDEARLFLSACREFNFQEAAQRQSVIRHRREPSLEDIMDIGDIRGCGVKESRKRTAGTVPNVEHPDQNIEEFQQLLPRIPNEITIAQISPMLPWTTFHMLSSVSHAWQRAIQSHQVYDARVCSKSTETLVVLCGKLSKGLNALILCSMEDNSYYRLPLIPGVNRGIPFYCECVFLDGKLYILGGWRNDGGPSIEVYVLDLVGQRQWKQCASMMKVRELFGCGVKDGKIYVFGGYTYSNYEPVYGSEVYDPKEDAWSPITPMPSLGYLNKVTAMGDELFVHGGDIYNSDCLGLFIAQRYHPRKHAQIYHPLKDEWRVMENFYQGDGSEIVLMVGDKFYRLSDDGIEVYHVDDAGTWNKSNNSSPIVFDVDVLLPFDSLRVHPFGAIAVDDEILAMVMSNTVVLEFGQVSETSLIRSKHLGGGNKKIVWQKLKCPLSLGDERLMCPIQL